MHGGKSTGAPKGNKNALKHGVFTTGTIKQRKELSTLIQNSRRILNEEV